ncbi:MAG: putative selenium-dependent hydroxylase accessory protein YqeC [Firmicutes bacterium HGW-Firmicutes-16]|nr:MAG: putative selenium-dependent hydroxylase accessory protein YqeC [Firmicutes bacterium HGW-Firmicutes-16]
MRILVKNKTWMETASFSEALASLIKASTQIAVVGSGGKTSIIMRIAEEQKALNKRVLVLTTTHMFTPERYGVFSGLAIDVENALRAYNIAIVGKETDDGKITWLGDELYQEIAPMADIILIEADGSKRLPLKFPNESEPVIPPYVDIILAVYGLSAIGRRGSDACHRWNLARAALDISNDDEIVKPEHMSLLMREAYLNPLNKKFPSAYVIPIFNQADNEALVDIGEKIIDELKPEMGIVSSILPL